MPVSVLLCEGGRQSPDVRVLVRLLAGRCVIEPQGGRYGMGQKVQVRREVLGPGVFGLLDGDFQGKWASPEERPVPWTASTGEHLGWRWERKEVENYLVDPVVVARALGGKAPDPDAYRAALHAARDTIAVYQAARTALASCRVRFRDLKSKFGKRRGREQHRFPDNLDEASCRDEVRKVVADHRETQLVEAETVLERMTALLPEHVDPGDRFRDYLAAFAGKDLLWAMDASLRDLGFASSWAFREAVLLGLAGSLEDPGDWLPEWKALQEAVDSA